MTASACVERLEPRALLSAASVVSVVATGTGITGGTGDLNADKTVTLTINVSDAVTVDTAGGSPTLSLNTGGTASYTGGSGTSALAFQYTVAAGENSSDLAVTAFNPNGSAIQNGGLDSDLTGAVANPSGTLQIDTVAPTVSMALIGASTQFAGTELHYAVTFSESVTGVDASGFSLTATGVSGASITSVTGSGSSYTVNVSSGSGVGTIGLNILGSNINDLAGNGFGGGSFVDQTTFTTGSAPISVTRCDVNGDGKLDLVVANLADNTVSVLLGNGDGTFADQMTFGTGLNPISVTNGDLNGDGKLDLVAANLHDNTVSVLLGNGDGTFADQMTFDTGVYPNSVTLGDVNGDGKLDLAVANRASDSVSVLLGNGDGTFADQVTFDAGAYPSSVTLGDVNGDGKPDLAVTNLFSDSLSVLLGNGDGSFADPTTFAVGTEPISMMLGDVNGDGRLDFVVANYLSGGISVLLGNGDGTFAIPTTLATGPDPYSVRLGDVNGDGKLDVTITNLTSDLVGVLLGNGDGTFAAQTTFATEQGPSGLTLGDFNGDGRLDLAISNYISGTVSVLLNGSSLQSGPVFTMISAATVTSVVATGAGITSGTGAVNAGHTVMLTVNFSEPVTVNDANGSPTLSLSSGGTASFAGGSGSTALTFVYTIAAGENTSDLTVTSFNFNGSAIYSDVSGAVTNPTGILQIDTVAPTVSMALIGASSQLQGTVLHYAVTFSEPVTGVDSSAFSLTTFGVTGASITSVTGSGASYTVNVSSGSGVGTIGLNITGTGIRDLAGNGFGGGSFANQTTFAVGAGPDSITMGDVNGDGTLDLVVANFGSDTVSVLLGNGDGTFANPSTFATESKPTSLTLGDINGDGKLDLVVANLQSDTVSVLLGNGNGTFANQATFATGAKPVSLTLGDVNGDGKLDLAVANDDGTVSVLLGNGDGTFSAQTTFAADSTPRSVTLGDVNGDGKLDLAVANFGSDTVSILLGNGNGTFAAQTTFATGSKPYSVTMGDVNGDGKLDLAVANATSKNVSVLLGNGNGTFAAQTTFAAGLFPISVTFGDVNGDGKLDLVVANHDSDSVSVLAGSGNGTFAAQTSFATGSGPWSVILGDVNGDGKLDLAVTNASSNSISVLMNGNSSQSGPVFTILSAATVTSVVSTGPGITGGTGDFNAGKSVTLTVNFSDSVTVNTTSGSPTLSLSSAGTASYTGGSGTSALTFQYTVAAGENTSDLTVTAFNLNGSTIRNSVANSDLTGAVTNPSGILQIDTVSPTVNLTLVGTSSQFAGTSLQYLVTFTEPVTGVDASGFSLTTSGVSGASISSVTGSGSSYTVNVSSGSGAGTIGLNIIGSNIRDLAGNGFGGGAFGAQTTFAPGTNPHSVVLGDVNGDGRLDLVFTNYDYPDNAVIVQLGNGDGTFATARDFATGKKPYCVALGDVNGDGKLDLVVANAESDTVSVLLGNGDGTFATQTTFATGRVPYSVALGDVNGDGKLDLAVVNRGSSTVSVLLGNGDGTFATQTTFATGKVPYSVALGDVNGDGKLDLAVANFQNYSVSVLLGNGDGTFKNQTTVAKFQYPASVALGDVNGDGKLDLVAANTGGGAVSVLLGNGNGTFAAQTTFAAGRQPYSVTLGDLNGDGKLDIVVTNDLSNNVSVLLGNGNGTFAPQTTYATGSYPTSVTLGDVNGDGKLDLVVANFFGSAPGISVLLNGNSAQVGPVYTMVKQSPSVSVDSLNLTYGTTLTNSQLSGIATVTVGGVTVAVAGTYSYSTAENTLLNAGNSQSVSVTFTPTDTTLYNSVMTTVQINVARATAKVVVKPYLVTYDGQSHTATVTSITGVNGETGSMVGTVDLSGTTHTTAGIYSNDSWTFTGASNYNNIVAQTITDTISANVAAISLGWGTSGSAALVDASGGRLLAAGRTTDLPWFSVNKLTVTLDQAVSSFSPSNVSIIGVVGGNYGPVSITGSGTTWTITLAKPVLLADKLTLTIVNVASYQRRLDILPGDVNDDGVVSAADMTKVNNAIGQAYNIFADINGDLIVSLDDVSKVRLKVGSKLPA